MTTKIKEFMNALHKNCEYWNKQKDRSELEKLEGCTFSILVMLDGASLCFDGDINTISSFDGMLHDEFYEEKDSK